MDLSVAYAIINDAAHQPVRNQLEMAVWVIATRKKLDSTTPTTGVAFNLVERVILGDQQPITLTLYAFATDDKQQAAYVAANNTITDDALLTYVESVWDQVASLGSQ